MERRTNKQTSPICFLSCGCCTLRVVWLPQCECVCAHMNDNHNICVFTVCVCILWEPLHIFLLVCMTLYSQPCVYVSPDWSLFVCERLYSMCSMEMWSEVLEVCVCVLHRHQHQYSAGWALVYVAQPHWRNTCSLYLAHWLFTQYIHIHVLVWHFSFFAQTVFWVISCRC